VSSWRSRCLQPLVSGADHPQRTAAAFAIGTFLSFSPLLGLQIATGLTAAFTLRLNRPALLIGLCTNLPWIMVPWYTLTTLAGARILGLSLPADMGNRLSRLLNLRVFTAEFWTLAGDLVAPLAWAFLVGSTAAAIIVGMLAYVAALRFLMRIRNTSPNS
jgi:uncharacterized protein (DUF2062 family)